VVTRGFATAAVLLMAAPLFAQSADPVFQKSWTWTPETLASEASGLGGAYATTVRGHEALYWSPAALTFDSGLDVRVGLGGHPGFGVVLHGDVLHLGFGLRRTFAHTRHGDGFDAGSGVFEVGQLTVALDQLALGAGLRAGRLRAGVALLAGPLSANGAWSRTEAGGSPTEVARELRYDYTGIGAWQVGVTSSAIFDVLGTHPMARDQMRFGVAVRAPTLGGGPRYRQSRLTLRYADGAAGSLPFEGSGPEHHHFRLPTTVSLGAEARISVFSTMVRTVRVAFGADWTNYDGVLNTARDNSGPAADVLTFDRRSPWELGGGIEGHFPLFRLRLGVRERPAHALVVTGTPPRSRTPIGTFGASRDLVIGGKRLQFDVDAVNTFDDVVVSARLLW
jgi:hypothetical protein